MSKKGNKKGRRSKAMMKDHTGLDMALDGVNALTPLIEAAKQRYAAKDNNGPVKVIMKDGVYVDKEKEL